MSYNLTLQCGCVVYVSAHPKTRVAHTRIIQTRGADCRRAAPRDRTAPLSLGAAARPGTPRCTRSAPSVRRKACRSGVSRHPARWPRSHLTEPWPPIDSRRPGAVAIERQRDVDVGAQRPRDRVPVLLAPQQRLPRIEVLRLVEVAVGDVRDSASGSSPKTDRRGWPPPTRRPAPRAACGCPTGSRCRSPRAASSGDADGRRC